MKTSELTVSRREVALILGSLRLAQEQLDVLGSMPQLADEGVVTNAEEIDRLCDRINFGEGP